MDDSAGAEELKVASDEPWVASDGPGAALEEHGFERSGTAHLRDLGTRPGGWTLR